MIEIMEAIHPNCERMIALRHPNIGDFSVFLRLARTGEIVVQEFRSQRVPSGYGGAFAVLMDEQRRQGGGLNSTSFNIEPTAKAVYEREPIRLAFEHFAKVSSANGGEAENLARLIDTLLAGQDMPARGPLIDAKPYIKAHFRALVGGVSGAGEQVEETGSDAQIEEVLLRRELEAIETSGFGDEDAW